MDEKQKNELEEIIDELESKRGRHTQLVTVMIPAGFNANQVVRQLEAEKSTAANIKSKQTKTNVTDALDMIIRKLKEINRTPENGLAIFAGNISEKEGTSDVQIWVVEPPKPLKTRMYRCDQTFVIEPLKEMMQTEDIYGLLAIDRKDAIIGLLEGKEIKVLSKLSSGVPGKIRAGGQSSQRFHRITEGLAKEFFRRVSEEMKKLFFELPRLKGIMIGGPIPTKEEFLEEGLLVTKLKEKVIAVKDIGYVDEHGLGLLVDESQEDIQEQEFIKEKKIVERFFETLGKNKTFAAYGEERVNLALDRGAVDTLLISKDYNKEKAAELEKKANNIGSHLIIISTETHEGEQFFNITKGVGVILRFPIE